MSIGKLIDAPLIRVRDWQVVGTPLSQEIMRSLFSGFRNIFARASTPDLRRSPITERRMQFFETERASHPRRSITHRLHEQTTERSIRIRASDTYRISDPYRFPIVLSSNLEYIRSSGGNETTMTTTLQGCKCALREFSPAGTAIAVLKKRRRCFATRLLAIVRK